jgi:hypothetical protein
MLRDDELAWLNAQDGRCSGCGHLTMLHIDDEDEPCTCAIDGCDCIDGRNAQQREEDERRRDEIMAQHRENTEYANAFLERMRNDAAFRGCRILWAHSPSAYTVGRVEVAWLRGLAQGECAMVIDKGLKHLSIPCMTSDGYGTFTFSRTDKVHRGMVVFE